MDAYKEVLLTGSWDNLVMVWDLTNGAKLATLDGHGEVVNCLKMKTYSFFVSGSGDSSLKVWNLSISKTERDAKSSPKLVCKVLESKTLIGHQSDVYCVDTCGRYVASGGADSLVIIWSVEGELLSKLAGHLGIVRYLFLDEYKLVSAGDARKIMVWNYKVRVLEF
jgi:WD40 repeat protein